MELIGNINLAESRGTLQSYANPEKRSLQDGADFKYKDKRLSLWKARYSYSPQATSGNSRDFCIKMVDVAKSGLVYRKEDIIKMGNDGVHSELAASGRDKYSIWLYKGGALCHHFWKRHIYVRKWNAVNIPSWLHLLADLPIPTLNNKYAQAAAFLLISGTSLPVTDKKRMFANIIDYKAFIEQSTRGYFQRYLMDLTLPNSIKAVLFTRFGKTFNTSMTFFRGFLRGRKFPVQKLNSRLPALGANLDFEDAGKLFDNLTGVFKDVTRGMDRKIGIPRSRSKTKKLENAEEIAVREARRRAIKYPENDRKVHIKPVNMINRGYMPTRKQIFKSTITKILK